MLKDMGETAEKQIDIAVNLRARDYKGLDNYGSNGVIEWKKITDAIGIVLFESEKFGGKKVLRGGGICPTLRANKTSSGVIEVMADVNVIGSLEAKFESTNRIYDVGGCSPTLSTMQGGNQEPKILEEQIPCKLDKMPNGHLDSLDNAEICDINTPTASTVTSRYYKGIGSHKDNMCIVAMRGRNPDNPSDRTAGSLTEQRLEVNMQGTSNCLTSVQKDNLLLENNIQKVGQISSNGSQCGTVISDNGISANLVAGTHGYANSHIATQYRIRKLTPRECGRLMCVSDEDIDKMAAVNSNTQLYKQFGNSIVVDVMCAMFKNLNIKQGDSNETLQAN